MVFAGLLHLRLEPSKSLPQGVHEKGRFQADTLRIYKNLPLDLPLDLHGSKALAQFRGLPQRQGCKVLTEAFLTVLTVLTWHMPCRTMWKVGSCKPRRWSCAANAHFGPKKKTEISGSEGREGGEAIYASQEPASSILDILGAHVLGIRTAASSYYKGELFPIHMRKKV